LKTDTFLTR